MESTLVVMLGGDFCDSFGGDPLVPFYYPLLHVLSWFTRDKEQGFKLLCGEMDAERAEKERSKKGAKLSQIFQMWGSINVNNLFFRSSLKTVVIGDSFWKQKA